MSTLETTTSLDPSKEFGDKINFVLCHACFWCASYFNWAKVISKCPSCGNDNIESLPISQGEIYSLSHNRIRGITLEFWKHGDVLK